MSKEHTYKAHIKWTGNRGEGTSHYKSYDRSHQVKVAGKQVIESSSDPAFMGDASKYNPEELLVASLSSCHMLWFLHLCADNGIVVIDYNDEAMGTMVETLSGGHFTEVVLHPVVTITDKSKMEKANELHHEANKKCFIANSCNFPVMHKPTCMLI
ncbi:MAG: OsmC family protein [Ferruginibacter sp.]